MGKGGDKEVRREMLSVTLLRVYLKAFKIDPKENISQNTSKLMSVQSVKFPGRVKYRGLSTDQL